MAYITALVSTILVLLLFYNSLTYTLSPLLDEFRLNPSSKWFDFKKNSAGLKYEFAMALRCDKIVWMRGPFPASEHDITIFRGGKANESEDSWDKESLYFATKKLGDNIRGVGDSGYAGEPGTILTSKEGQTKELREFLARAKSREETLHTRCKCWNILENRFRHGHGTEKRMEVHGDVMSAIAVITQYDFENGAPPFEVRWFWSHVCLLLHCCYCYNSNNI